MFSSSLTRLCEKQLKSFPKVYFDLKAFRKGISEKKRSLIEAEKRAIDRAYAKPAPEGWTVSTFLEKAKITSSVDQLAACFLDWNDFISSSRKDLMRVSYVLTADEVKKLAHAIELFNHGLFGVETRGNPAFSGRNLTNENAPWTPEDDALLVHLAVEKYDYTFGDVWLYVSWEMQRSMDEVADRFSEIFLKPKNKSRGACEVLLTKSFRPLLMNRQFRLVPPQCYVVPSEGHLGGAQVTPFILPSGFAKYATKQT
jgi:hypothetical protein